MDFDYVIRWQENINSFEGTDPVLIRIHIKKSNEYEK